MSLSPALEALKLEALQITCITWALSRGWKLADGVDRYGPCPSCRTGTKRFSIHTTKHLFLCRKCGIAGHGVIDLVMQTEDLGFEAACERITGRKAENPKDPAQLAKLKREAEDNAKAEAKAQNIYRERARQQGHAIWQRGRDARDCPDDDPVIQYLLGRGISLETIRLINYLRSVEELKYVRKFDGKYRTLHIGWGMLAAIILPGGKFGAVHQTYVTELDGVWTKAPIFHPDTGEKLPSKLVRGSKKGGAILLYTPEDRAKTGKIIMGEGIETTLTVMSAAFDPDTAYWAGVDLGNMAGRAQRDENGKQVPDQPDMGEHAGQQDSFVPPIWCKELVYLGEDQNPDAPKKAKQNRDALTRGLRRAQALRPGLKTSIAWPEGVGDFNDMVQSVG